MLYSIPGVEVFKCCNFILENNRSTDSVNRYIKILLDT
jgi:hypothetical protein